MRIRSLQRATCVIAMSIGIIGNAPESSRAADGADTNAREGSDVPASTAAPDLTASASDSNSELTEVVVTGTRRTGMTVADSPAPVQVLSSSVLGQVGQPDLMQTLTQNVPSLITNEQAFAVDTGELTYSLKLRGLSPNDVLVLVDGKRRHTTANLAVDGGPFQGAAAADLNFIPVSAIDHIEVLQEGAAAQYGSDAIAGVVNIILKNDPAGGSAVVSGGRYFDGGGETYDVSLNKGFEPGGPGSYFNFTVEARTHDRSDRSAIDPRVVDPATIAANPNLLLAPGYPYLSHIDGDPYQRLAIASYNAGFRLGDSTDVYSFGTYGHKYASGDANYRLPDKLPELYPYGFTPTEVDRKSVV